MLINIDVFFMSAAEGFRIAGIFERLCLVQRVPVGIDFCETGGQVRVRFLKNWRRDRFRSGLRRVFRRRFRLRRLDSRDGLLSIFLGPLSPLGFDAVLRGLNRRVVRLGEKRDEIVLLAPLPVCDLGLLAEVFQVL